MACASGADRRKIMLQLEKVGFSAYFSGRCFSGYEMPQSKPAPDVYLAAAKALGVNIADCAVIEDSPTGVQAGVAAGAHVLAYVPENTLSTRALGGAQAMRERLMRLGARGIFAEMQSLPAMLGC
jgi:beta-phosphoglucomutase-like phosphatase (HAD superfamily)